MLGSAYNGQRFEQIYALPDSGSAQPQPSSAYTEYRNVYPRKATSPRQQRKQPEQPFVIASRPHSSNRAHEPWNSHSSIPSIPQRPSTANLNSPHQLPRLPSSKSSNHISQRALVSLLSFNRMQISLALIALLFKTEECITLLVQA
ncbi:hypothetical protein Ciccas_003431 [Cichlidogyrus casuarinus]|uniref:Uncharacterized protein n=1 Tax=Cichlidogyrus casuarinus TaxID=1844966 RepID=A0ABD2QEU0_9PLAT